MPVYPSVLVIFPCHGTSSEVLLLLFSLNINEGQKKVRHDPMANQEQEATADGWEFRLVDDHLSITSQSDSAKQVQLSSQASLVLLNYLSQHRDTFYWLAHQGQRDEPEHDPRLAFADIEETG
jgi:hypothetical protein